MFRTNQQLLKLLILVVVGSEKEKENLNSENNLNFQATFYSFPLGKYPVYALKQQIYVICQRPRIDHINSKMYTFCTFVILTISSPRGM